MSFQNFVHYWINGSHKDSSNMTLKILEVNFVNFLFFYVFFIITCIIIFLFNMVLQTQRGSDLQGIHHLGEGTCTSGATHQFYYG